GFSRDWSSDVCSSDLRVEGLGAVAALEQERLSTRDGGHPGTQLVALAGEHQRRIRFELGDHIAQSLGIRVLGLLRRGQVSPSRQSGRASRRAWMWDGQ